MEWAGVEDAPTRLFGFTSKWCARGVVYNFEEDGIFSAVLFYILSPLKNDDIYCIGDIKKQEWERVTLKKGVRMLVFILVMTGLLIPSRAGAGDWIVDPCREYGYEEMLEDAAALQRRYPELIRLGSIGSSVEGRSLLLIELGSGSRDIFINGAIHGSEYISTSYLMYMIDTYARAYQGSGAYGAFDLKAIFNSVTFCIVPMVNPDGVNLVQNGVFSTSKPALLQEIAARDPSLTDYDSWKANINGVDLNRNFDHHWHVVRPVTQPAAKFFKGEQPVSEPETKAVQNYTSAKMFWTFLSFHSQGGGLYGWDDPNSRYYPQLNSMVSRILAASGYQKLSDTYETDYGTFAGFSRETFLKPALTVELCDYISSRPYPDERFMDIWAPAQLICLIVAEEVMRMAPQEYLVFQNGIFLQAFCEEARAHAYARGYEHSAVLYLEGGAEALPLCRKSADVLLLGGSAVSPNLYTIGGSNYIRIRDLAMLLNGTERQFAVAYDAQTKAVSLTSGQPYTPIGGELPGPSGSAESVPTDFIPTEFIPLPATCVIRLDGNEIRLPAYYFGGSNYVGLRDMGKALNLGIAWDGGAQTILIDTVSGYVD
jgi:hypothetical protein